MPSMPVLAIAGARPNFRNVNAGYEFPLSPTEMSHFG